MAGWLFHDVRVVPRRLVAEEWAPSLRVLWRPGLHEALAMGRELAAAKRSLRHGEFGRLFHDHRDAVADPLPFSWRSGQRLMAVARHRVLADPALAPHFPAGWSILERLAQLPPERVVAGIRAGWVHSRMRRLEIGGEVEVVGPVVTDGDVVVGRIEPIVLGAIEQLWRFEREHVAFRLESLAAAVRRSCAVDRSAIEQGGEHGD